jgi:type 1 glutamine amidotransferase
VLLIERGRIVAALPAKAPATPRQPRKLLIFNGSANHPSVPYADLAMQLMGEKTGAFTTTISGDPSVLQAESLKQYDAVYLNNNVGTQVDVFGTPELRQGFLDYVANGGGLVASHGTSVASPKWTEFGELLGATGASHRESDEKAIVHVEDPNHPITRAFGGKSFELIDEFYRFQAPFSRERLRVLLTVDPASVNEQQGRCYGRCFREDNDYAVAWIRQHGKGRVFYTALGHNPDLFWDPRMLEMFLAGTQYALGDLDADATPKPRAAR